jgi:hypothetical protein
LCIQLKEADQKAVKFHREYCKAMASLEKTTEEKKALETQLRAAEEEVKR